MPSNNISDSDSISDILKLISFDSVLLLDLDNTVIESQIELGSDAWFVRLCMHALDKIPEREQAISMAIALYHEVQQIVRAQAVEYATAKLIKAIQDIGIPVLAITARDRCLQGATLRQLYDSGVQLTDLGIIQQELDIDKNTVSTDQAIYSDSIIYCGGKDKGACFKALLQQTGIKPKHIVMVDDKLKHLEHVKEVVEAQGIRFDGVRYGYLDSKVASFNFDEAHNQLATVQKRLPSKTQEHIKCSSSNLI